MLPIDFYFFCGSTYTYLTVMRIQEVAAKAGVEVRWRPFNVRAIMLEQGNVPFADKPIKMAYMWRDVERRARRHEIEWASVPPYPIDKELLANRVCVVATEEGWCERFTKAAYRAWFLEGCPLGNNGTIEPILDELGQDPTEVIQKADSERVHAEYARQTDNARDLGIFGSPTFVVGKEIFWGDDRLEDALDWALIPR